MLSLLTTPPPSCACHTELPAILGCVTASFLSWLVPTLFAGTLVAAYVLPASAANNASNATAIAGDGLRSSAG
jgi:hypothetical protein